jgi:hypothetical protein
LVLGKLGTAMNESTRGPTPKVARLIERYDLTGIGDELERQWTATEDRMSLRELTDEFNKRLLHAAITDAGASPIDGEVENLYRLLTNDEVSSAARSQAQDRLTRDDVDVDQLVTDFVSRQAIHTYLAKYRDATPPDTRTTDETQRSHGLTTIQRLKTRLESVTESVLSDLTNGKGLTLGDFSVIVTVRIHCADCRTQHSVKNLIETGGCDCSDATD